MFEKLKRRFGVGGPSVDTVLGEEIATPGGSLIGQVNLDGGDHDVDIEHIELSLLARTEIEGQESESSAGVEFARFRVNSGMHLPAGATIGVRFQVPLSWETPMTHIYGRPLPGMVIGLRTELAVAKEWDKGDFDPVAVHALPSQVVVLEAMARMGFLLSHADVEAGAISGVHQELPFYQELEFTPPEQYAGVVGQVEATFITDAEGFHLVMEASHHGGGDRYGRFQVAHAQAAEFDWEGHIRGWLDQVAASGHHGHAHMGESEGGSVWGAVGGVAAGVGVGLLAGELTEELFGSEEEEEEE
ncbi:sporulation-control protein [Stackebrandtia endophytica]|uniref:Sporulation-control protein n=1 Tax=Stackebrandtia endophytica TaxID=1496996 RepID=A0A543B3Q5_9ACTN|nr:sporulation protein [Stackebrandtia endophytica]TQL79432.1 sporulation-control protein [Stackebrandtia endophytica]